MKRLKNKIAFSLFGLAWSVSLPVVMTALPAHAESEFSALKLAHQAAVDGNYAQAYCIWIDLAKQGSREAQHNIGWMYHNGYGMAINEGRAAHWWKLAAAQGHAEANFDLGQLYFYGGVKFPQDHLQAVDYFLAAARSNHEDARFMLSVLATTDDPQLRERFSMLIRNTPELKLLPTAKVRVRTANLRSGPATTFKVVGQLKQGATVVVVSQKKDWLQIVMPEAAITGWVFQSLLTSVSQAGNAVTGRSDAP